MNNDALAKEALLGVIRFLDERGYGIEWDGKENCYRIVLLGLDPINNEYVNKKFTSIEQAYYTVLQTVVESPPY